MSNTIPVESKFATLVENSNIGASGDVRVDQGDQIDVRKFKHLKLLINLTANNSTSNYIEIYENVKSTDTNNFHPVNLADYQEVLGDSDAEISVYIDVYAANYIRVRSASSSVGATPATLTIKYKRQA
jgi:hypothetical protein